MKKEEIALVVEAQRGNVKSFEELYMLYHRKVFAVIRATVKNGADAEDILQQTFLSAWRNLKNLGNPAAFNTWIQRIALNQCYALLRKKNIAILLDSEDELDQIAEDAAGDLIPAVYAEREDLRIRLGRILEGLSDVQRQTITLFYFNELKVEEIAEVMDCSVNTVKTRLFLARKAIRGEVEEQERKSGQKFYGAIGAPMLPLAQVIAGQIEAASLSSAASGGILGGITSSIASEAAVAAQGAASAAASSGSMGAAAAGTAAKAGMALGAKIAIGAIVAAVIIAGAVLIPRYANTVPEEAPNTVAADSAENAEESPGDGANTAAISDTPTDDAYYDSLTEEQKQMLSRLEAALRASDYQTAHGIQSSDAFHALCDAIPDWGGFWYYPDAETSAVVYRGEHDSGPSYEMALYIGEGGNGEYRLGRLSSYDGIFYALSEASYSDGKANGPFVTHFYFLDEGNGEVALHRFEGMLVDGKATGQVDVYKEGAPFGYSRLESHGWWPDWPQEAN